MKYLLYFLLLCSISLQGEIITSNDNISFESFITEHIDSSSEDIFLYTSLISSKKIVNALINNQDNCNIHIIISENSLSKSYSLHTTLLENGLSAFSLSTLGYQYYGTFIIKDKEIIWGNFDCSQDKYNENSHIFTSNSKQILSDYKDLFNLMMDYSYSLNILPDTITVEEINEDPKKFSNQYCIITGKVKKVIKSKNSDTYFLYFSDNRDEYKVVIFSNIYNDMKKASISPMYFINKQVFVKGTIILHPKYGTETLLSSYKCITY